MLNLDCKYVRGAVILAVILFFASFVLPIPAIYLAEYSGLAHIILSGMAFGAMLFSPILVIAAALASLFSKGCWMNGKEAN